MLFTIPTDYTEYTDEKLEINVSSSNKLPLFSVMMHKILYRNSGIYILKR